ncbi:MAG: polysaccharide biosynthesis/export family protein [Planctomycetota bacterium]
MTRTHLRTLLALALGLGLLSCTTLEPKRIRQLLNEKGFGTRAQGIATMENYLAGGDGVAFVIDPTVLLSPGAEQLAFLTQVQQVGLDGTILVPYVGPVLVLGLTEMELKAMVQERLQAFFNFEVSVTPRIVNLGKAIYAFGEVGRKGRVPFTKPDVTIMEAVASVYPTPSANLGRVRLVRPDAENPLVVEINFREMIMTGNTTYNILLRENDIIYIPPTWLGAIGRFVEKLLSPLGSVVQAAFGFASIRYSYDVLRGEDVGYFHF